MAFRWFTPWRVTVLAAGWLLPPALWFAITAWAPPSPLRFDPPVPRMVAAQHAAALADMEAGRLDAAREKLAALRAEDALNPMIHATLGEVAHRAGRTTEAIAFARMALSLDPTMGEVAYNLACDLVSLQALEPALEALRQAIAAGMDVRTAAADDGDLDLLRTDPRFQIYLEGASTIPPLGRSVQHRFVPGRIHVREPFELLVEVFAMGEPSRGAAPAVSVIYTGPQPPLQLELRKVTTSQAVLELDGARHFRWQLRYELEAREAGALELRGWEFQLAGVQLPMSNPITLVLPSLDLAADLGGPGHPGEVGPSARVFFSHEFGAKGASSNR